MRAHPGARELLRAGRGVSLLLPGPGDDALELALLPRPEGGCDGFLCTPRCAALPRSFPARLRAPLTEAFALLPLLARQMDPAADPGPLLQLERCCYRMLHSICLLSGLSLLSGGSPGPGRAADLASVARGLCEAAQGALLPGLPPVRWAGAQTPLPVGCGPELLSLAVAALLDNALRFSRDGNEITVSTALLPGGRCCGCGTGAQASAPSWPPASLSPFSPPTRAGTAQRAPAWVWRWYRPWPRGWGACCRPRALLARAPASPSPCRWRRRTPGAAAHRRGLSDGPLLRLLCTALRFLPPAGFDLSGRPPAAARRRAAEGQS